MQQKSQPRLTKRFSLARLAEEEDSDEDDTFRRSDSHLNLEQKRDKHGRRRSIDRFFGSFKTVNNRTKSVDEGSSGMTKNKIFIFTFLSVFFYQNHVPIAFLIFSYFSRIQKLLSTTILSPPRIHRIPNPTNLVSTTLRPDVNLNHITTKLKGQPLATF